MTLRHLSMEADLATIADAVGIAPRTVVALPPSSVDPVWDEMRVVINGRVVLRAFDPGEDIVTEAPIAYVTKAGDHYVTKAGNRYVGVVE